MSEAKIAEHRRMVVMTGNLSDFQIKNLRTWPYVVFEKQNIEKVEVDYNFTKDAEDGEELNAGSVTYNFQFKVEPGYSKEELKKRLDALEAWVKHLFWSDTEVNFKKKGKKWQI